MNQRKPLRFLQLFSKEELQDLLEESAYNPAPQVIITKPKAIKAKVSNVAPKRSIYLPARLTVKPPEQSKLPSRLPQPKQPDEKAARKKLFVSGKKEIVKQGFKVKTISKLRRNPSLNDSSPLIDISSVENRLPAHLEFKKSRERKRTTPSQASYTCGNQTNELSKISSAGEREFVELEQKYEVNNKRSTKRNKINAIIKTDSEAFDRLKSKFDSLQMEFDDYASKHEENMKEIAKLLGVGQDATVAKQVTFATEDEGLEKAITMYNSIRKNCNSILRTPKGNRSCLQTPKSEKKVKDALSIKLQKQCLMLQDTPRK
ncbi:hypothetical protein PPYR_12558 [Photinus pyralis]|uniref:Uncharacterized protein n=1 Tax=Photinus pyralis TaxID=7054 RepID=A0A1Y1NCW2_PHOPY|nr:uncharacterized protein LOC116177575 [Photinus pyralis]KAB0792938.1 hypothetical protein PPYR_12558 [Photinus pyralis]